MIFLRSLFFNIFLFGGIAVACIIALPLLFIKDKHMICAGKILSKYIGFLLKIFIDVKINFKGVENQNLPKLKECYLRTMSHTINPTGGGFKVDGKPNEIDMTLSFVENQTLDKDDIKAGF